VSKAAGVATTVVSLATGPGSVARLAGIGRTPFGLTVLTKAGTRLEVGIPRPVDANVLVKAAAGNEAALAYIRSGPAYITSWQRGEVLAGGLTERLAFLEGEGIGVLGGPPSSLVAEAHGISKAYAMAVEDHGYGDATFFAYAKAAQRAGWEAASERTLFNFVKGLHIEPPWQVPPFLR